MILTIETPIKMRIDFENHQELQAVKEALTYKNTSIQYQIKITKESAIKYGKAWAANKLAELEQKLYETLLFVDNEGYYTRPGLLKYLQKRFNCSVKNNIVYPEFKLLPWHTVPEYEPHNAQLNALKRLLSDFHSHIEFATGTGKTFIIELLIKNTGLPTVVSTPSTSIARQIYEECQALFGNSKVGLFGDTKRELGKHILIAVGKSLAMVNTPKEIEEFKKYQVLISDESHTLPAEQFEKFCHGLLAHCPYRWFVSGTQERSDGTDLKLLSIIGPQVYAYPIQKAIEDGVLAKLSFLIFNIKSHSFFESNNIVRLNQEHIYKNEKIAQIISEISQQAVAENMPVLILIDEHIQEEILSKYMKIDYVYARSGANNSKICKDFNDGKIMCVVGNSAVSTGTNFKPVRITINWQAGKSAVKVKQGPIGRSTRIDKRTGKTECKVIDFRIKNVPILRRHSDERISIYKEIGEVIYADLD
ncbi:MAG: DEAD/DEAH box helicase [Patescibacteria group bacterium]|nr:DEAD/DEAH box helicase [Patescibacteria group bacterium]